MQFRLTDEQARELRTLLDQVLGDLSYEITATDNPQFRAELRARRDTLTVVWNQLVNPAVASAE